MKHEKIVGLDLGDKFSYACVLDFKTGKVLQEKRIATQRVAWGPSLLGNLACE